MMPLDYDPDEDELSALCSKATEDLQHGNDQLEVTVEMAEMESQRVSRT